MAATVVKAAVRALISGSERALALAVKIFAGVGEAASLGDLYCVLAEMSRVVSSASINHLTDGGSRGSPNPGYTGYSSYVNEAGVPY